MRELKLSLYIIAFIFALGAHGNAQSIMLPGQMGQINDYAAQLGSEQRERLALLVDRLASHANVNANLLITLVDPFSNTSRFASALWEEWQLPQEKSLLLIFVREQNNWFFHWESSADLSSLMSDLNTETEIFDRSLQLVKERRIADAAVEAFEQLSLQFAGPEIEELSAPADEVNEIVLENLEVADEVQFDEFTTESIASERVPENMTHWYIIGGIGGSILLFIIIRAIFLMTCPECGARLETRRSNYGGFHSRRSSRGKTHLNKTCPNCRYQRSTA